MATGRPSSAHHGGSISAWGIFFLPFPTGACFYPPPPSPNNLEYLLAVSKNLARPLHPVYDDGKGGGWKWISAYAACFAWKVCGLVQSTWGTSLGEDKLGASDRIPNTKVARRVGARRAPGKHSPMVQRSPKQRFRDSKHH